MSAEPVLDPSDAFFEIAQVLDRLDPMPASLSDPAVAVRLYQQAAAIVSAASILRDTLATRAGELLGGYKTVVDGKLVVRHRRRTYRNWQSDDLYRAVLDSRKIDKTTGEIVDETPLEKIVAVYGTGGYRASRGELRARGIDADEYADVEERGYTLRIETPS